MRFVTYEVKNKFITKHTNQILNCKKIACLKIRLIFQLESIMRINVCINEFIHSTQLNRKSNILPIMLKNFVLFARFSLRSTVNASLRVIIFIIIDYFITFVIQNFMSVLEVLLQLTQQLLFIFTSLSTLSFESISSIWRKTYMYEDHCWHRMANLRPHQRLCRAQTLFSWPAGIGKEFGSFSCDSFNK